MERDSHMRFASSIGRRMTSPLRLALLSIPTERGSTGSCCCVCVFDLLVVSPGRQSTLSKSTDPSIRYKHFKWDLLHDDAAGCDRRSRKISPLRACLDVEKAKLHIASRM